MCEENESVEFVRVYSDSKSESTWETQWKKKISFKEGIRSSLIAPSRKTTETISKNDVPDVFKNYFTLIIDNTFKTANTTHWSD